MATILRIPLHVVFYEEEGSWIAHCLELDLLGDGKNKLEAHQSLDIAIKMQIEASLEYNNPENLFSPAESKYWQMFAAGKDVVVGQLRLELDKVVITDVEAREYSEESIVQDGSGDLVGI